MKDNKFNYFKLLFRLLLIIILLFIIIDVTRIIVFQMKINDLVFKVSELYEETSSKKVIKDEVEKELPGVVININEETKFIEYKFVYRIPLITPGLNLILNDGFAVKNESIIKKD